MNAHRRCTSSRSHLRAEAVTAVMWFSFRAVIVLSRYIFIHRDVNPGVGAVAVTARGSEQLERERLGLPNRRLPARQGGRLELTLDAVDPHAGAVRELVVVRLEAPAGDEDADVGTWIAVAALLGDAQVERVALVGE